MIYISGLPLSFQYFLQTSIKTKKKKLCAEAIFGFANFFFTTAPPPNFCAVIRLLQKFQMASKRRSCVYTLLLRLQTHTEVRIGLVLRTYHLHFSRQLFVQRIEYIALLLRRSPANSCRYDIIAMNYSKPVATKT